MRDNLSRALEFGNTILVTTNLPQECYLEALALCKHWCSFSTSTFIPHEGLIKNLFNLL
jgi:hypothetical protein